VEGQKDGQGLEHSSCNKLSFFKLEKIWLQVDLNIPPVLMRRSSARQSSNARWEDDR